MHDEPYASAFIIKTVMEANGLVEGYSYWTFSDIFEENYFPSQAFHGGFGLMNLHGIAKPAYRAFELLHSLGTELLPVTGSHATVDAWVVRDGNSATLLLDNFALPRHAIKNETVTVELSGAPKPLAASIRRIDADHANAKRGWLEMGSPEYLDAAAVVALHKASEMTPETQQFHHQDGVTRVEVAIPPFGIAAIRLDADANARG
jgi:xylan 1,4-beta-xylosidase